MLQARHACDKTKIGRESSCSSGGFAFSKATKRNSLRTAAAENEQSEITGLSSASVQKGRMHGSLPNRKLQADRGSADGNNQPKKCRPAGDGGQLGSMYLSSGMVDVGL